MSDSHTPANASEPGAGQPAPVPTQPPVYAYPQSPPAPPQTAVPHYEQARPTPPPISPAPYAAPYVVQPERRSYGWIWALVVLVFLSGVIASCGWFAALVGGSSKSGVTTGPSIAVISIDGVIAGTGGAGVITPTNFLAQLDKAERDDNVRAIVLRVDSPGGTVAASEEIATYVRESKKPVVVSIGDVGASGAYMVSSQADKVFANPGSAVGSIGVITEIPNVAGLLTKLGVKFTVIHAGKFKDTGSPFRALSTSETALIQGSVNHVYGQFIDIVAEGRRMDRSKVESLATGWAWNGDEAKGLGLVDQIGTYRDALHAAAKLGGIHGTFQTVDYSSSKFENLLNSLLGARDRMSPLGALDPTGVMEPGQTLAK